MDAAPEDDAIALAVRYADILTGVDRDDAPGERHDGRHPADEDDDEDEADGGNLEPDPEPDAEPEDTEADDDSMAADGTLAAGGSVAADRTVAAGSSVAADSTLADGTLAADGTPAADGTAGTNGGATAETDAELAALAGGAGSAEAASFDAGDAEAREQLADGSEDLEAASPGGGGDSGGDGDGDGDDTDGGDGGGAAGGNPGQLAMLDAEQAPAGAVTGDDASFAAAAAGAEETYESWMRHRRPSRLGRLDFGVAWRTGWTAPRHAPAHRSDELWLVATWRR